jgi:excisionase family DNA binding protein
MSVNDVAERWAVSTDLVYGLIRNGALAAMKVAGTTWRVPTGAVIAYEQDQLTDRSVKHTPKSRRKPVLRL